MAVDPKQYLSELAKQAGLDDASTQSVLKVLENDKFSKELGNGLTRQSDYSRAQDELRTQQTAFERQQQEWLAWHEQVKTADAQRETELQSLRAKANGNPNPNPNGDPTQYVTRADYAKAVQEAETRALNTSVAIAKDAMQCQMDYYTRFGKSLDLDAIQKYAVEHNVTVKSAYDAVIAPEVKAKSDADFEAKLKSAREEGARDALSKHHIPTEEAPSEHVLFDYLKTPEAPKPASERTRAEAFAAEWEKAGVTGVQK